MAESRKRTDALHYASPDLGYYRRTSLDDIINNFIILYVGEGKVIDKIPRLEIAALAQRAVQEFSYDVFHSEQNIELELNPSLTVALPSDYVNYVQFSHIDANGVTRPLARSKRSGAGNAALQDQDFNYIYDSDGNVLNADESEQVKRFKDPANADIAVEIAENADYISDYNYSYYNESYYGRQWGIDPTNISTNGTFVLDEAKGLVHFDHTFYEGVIVNLRYISDGIGDNDDLSNVYVPKMAEDAVYSNILYNVSKVRPALGGVVGLYKKEAKAKLNNAKIRLMQIKPQEIEQVFRGKAKWIKH